MHVSKIASAMAATALLLLRSGCGEVEAKIDCHDICTDYEACVGDDAWDYDECVNKCEEEPNSEIDTCDVCLDSEAMGCGDNAAETTRLEASKAAAELEAETKHAADEAAQGADEVGDLVHREVHE